MVIKPQTTKERLQKLHDVMTGRACGFSQTKGLFSGQLIEEELNHWAKQLQEIIDEE